MGHAVWLISVCPSSGLLIEQTGAFPTQAPGTIAESNIPILIIPLIRKFGRVEVEHSSISTRGQAKLGRI